MCRFLLDKSYLRVSRTDSIPASKVLLFFNNEWKGSLISMLQYVYQTHAHWHTHTHTHTHVHINKHIHIYIYTRIYIYIHVCVCVCVCVCVYVCVYMPRYCCARTYVQAHWHTRMHSQTYARARACTHTHTHEQKMQFKDAHELASAQPTKKKSQNAPQNMIGVRACVLCMYALESSVCYSRR